MKLYFRRASFVPERDERGPRRNTSGLKKIEEGASQIDSGPQKGDMSLAKRVSLATRVGVC